MDGQNSGRLEVPEIELERLGGEEMDGNRIAREGVDRQYVEILNRLALEREPGVSHRDIELGFAIAQVEELLLGDAYDKGVDLVVAHPASGPAVRGQCPG